MRKKFKKNQHHIKSNRPIYNVLATFASTSFFLPIYFFLINSFKNIKAIRRQPLLLTKEMFTLNSIIEAWSTTEYPSNFFNSILVLSISCGSLIIIGSLASFAIVRIDSLRMRRLYTSIIALMTIPMHVAMIPLAKQLSIFGLIDTRGGIAVVYLAFGLPFTIFLFSGFMRTIPIELADSATIDGCGMFQTYLLIYMPLMKTVTGTLLILRGTYIWNDILVPLLTVRSPSRTTLPMTLVTLTTSRGTRWDIMFGASLLISLPIIFIFLVFQKSFISGIVAGAVKG